MSSANPDTRERILTAAWRLLESREGAAKAVPMSAIAKEAGLSRQAVYLHFPTRAELLIAVTRHVDQVKDVDARLAPSRAAKTGAARLAAFVDAWLDYVPEIYGVARAVMALRETDPAAEAAWSDRMEAMRAGCRAAIEALARDGALRAPYHVEEATDLLWMLLSVRNWELLTRDRGWEQRRVREAVKASALRLFVKEDA